MKLLIIPILAILTGCASTQPPQPTAVEKIQKIIDEVRAEAKPEGRHPGAAAYIGARYGGWGYAAHGYRR